MADDGHRLDQRRIRVGGVPVIWAMSHETGGRDLAIALLAGSRREPEITQRCEECGSVEHGRPRVSGGGAYVSWSRSGNLTVAVASQVEVSVDVENETRSRHVVWGALSEVERRLVAEARDARTAFLEVWTGKEALVKLGLTTLDDLATCDLAALVRDTCGLAVHTWAPDLGVVASIATLDNTTARPPGPEHPIHYSAPS